MATPDPEFQHIRTSMAGDVALVEVLTEDLQGPERSQELGAELTLVAAQEWARRMVVDFRRVEYMSSTGFAVLFRLVSQADAAGRQVKFCNMNPDVRIGADIVGLGKLVAIYDSEREALDAFAPA